MGRIQQGRREMEKEMEEMKEKIKIAVEKSEKKERGVHKENRG